MVDFVFNIRNNEADSETLTSYTREPVGYKGDSIQKHPGLGGGAPLSLC